jgi:hypothetical protein
MLANATASLSPVRYASSVESAMNRVRKSVYDAAARFRAEHNQVVVSEPRSRADLPV